VLETRYTAIYRVFRIYGSSNKLPIHYYHHVPYAIPPHSSMVPDNYSNSNRSEWTPQQEVESIVARASAFNPPAVPVPAKTSPPHRRTWAFVPDTPTAVDRAGTWQHVRRPGFPQIPLLSRDSEQRKSLAGLSLLAAPHVGQTQSQSGEPDTNHA
jgi:hypothetical protein